MARETVKNMKPHQKESFLARCRDWYRKAIKEILKRVDITDPVLKAVKDVDHCSIINGTASIDTGAVLKSNLPRLSDASLQKIDRQWRSPLVDKDALKSEWKGKTLIEFWKQLSTIVSYKELGQFIIQVTALPQSTAAVERAFSKINNNKTKLRNSLAVRTIEAIVKVSEAFPTNFPVNARLTTLHSKARNTYMERYTEKQRQATEDIEHF